MSDPPAEAMASPTPHGNGNGNGHIKRKWQFDMGDDSLSRARHSNTFFGRLRQSVSTLISGRRENSYAYDYHSAPSEDDVDDTTNGVPTKRPKRYTQAKLLHLLKRFLLRLPLFILMFLGVIHIMLAFYGGKSLLWDVTVYDPKLPDLPDGGKGLVDYPTDATRDVLPIPCHSHNDYWRRVPLFDAIHWGCTGVEADVWLFNDQDELLVGHSSSSLSPTRTLRSLYVDPLVDLLDKMNPQTSFSTTKTNGIFDTDASQTLVLLIDFKTNGHELYPRVQQDLEPLRKQNYLSHWDGKDFISRAITVVGTGNAPFDLIIANTTYRDIFFDAPLDKLYEPEDSSRTKHPVPKTRLNGRGQGQTGTKGLTPDAFNSSNSYYASVSMWAALGLPWTGDLSSSQTEKVRGQIRGAHSRGLKARYWETPAWPTSLRNRIWQFLVDEGVDMLNVDDLAAAAKGIWGEVGHTWVDA